MSTPTPKAAYVVTVTPTIMSGVVVRWFASVERAERFRPILSASRYEVIVDQEGQVTPALREQADAVMAALEADDLGAVRPLETHRRERITGPFLPVSNGDHASPGGAS